VIELFLLEAQAGFDVSKTLAVSELSKGQAKKLIPARKLFDIATALITIDAKLKRVGRQKIQEQRKNGSAKIHRLPPPQARRQ
jgi:hypothetical protein